MTQFNPLVGAVLGGLQQQQSLIAQKQRQQRRRAALKKSLAAAEAPAQDPGEASDPMEPPQHATDQTPHIDLQG